MTDNGTQSAATLRVFAEAMGLCWRATPYGETEDGDIAAYILPKGSVHRLVGALQSAGVGAALRNSEQPLDAEVDIEATLNYILQRLHNIDSALHGLARRAS